MSLKRKQIRLTEGMLHKVVKESVMRILSENGLTYGQIRNMTGITDDDDMNAAAEAEDREKLEDDIWNSLVMLGDGESPRTHVYNFKDVAQMLVDKFGFRYVGPDEKQESHIFHTDRDELSIYPKTFYPNQGTIRIENYGVMGKRN